MTNKKQPLLLATAPNLDGIKQCIARYYYEEKELQQVNEKEWAVYSGDKRIETVRVVKKGKRYRFEGI